MKEKPIIFNTQMVSAILDNRKTMTRRVIKSNPANPKWTGNVWIDAGNDNTVHFEIKCPYGKIGDRLWVRETWANLPELSPEKTIVYKATDWKGWLEYETETIKWKPSIHMFRRDSRINLEITDIRVEKVQDISKEDAIEEGCKNILSFFKVWDTINEARGYGIEINPYCWCILFKEISNEKLSKL